MFDQFRRNRPPARFDRDKIVMVQARGRVDLADIAVGTRQRLGNVASDDVDSRQPDAKILRQPCTGVDGGGMDLGAQRMVLGAGILIYRTLEDDKLSSLGNRALRQALCREIGRAFAVDADGTKRCEWTRLQS